MKRTCLPRQKLSGDWAAAGRAPHKAASRISAAARSIALDRRRLALLALVDRFRTVVAVLGNVEIVAFGIGRPLLGIDAVFRPVARPDHVMLGETPRDLVGILDDEAEMVEAAGL